jgi:predicted RNA-binding Zn-ribbon protein involved in translation (DUF1610 family)
MSKATSIQRIMESSTDETFDFYEGLPDVKDAGFKNDTIYASIGGTIYGYKALDGDKEIADVYKSFVGMLKYTQGKALAYLKKHTKQVSGGSMPEGVEEAIVIGDNLLKVYSKTAETIDGGTECPGCSLSIPPYSGAYPKNCPRCGKEMVRTMKSEIQAQIPQTEG